MMKVAGVQMDGGPADKEVNIKKAAKFIDEAARKGAELVVLQELFATGYFTTKVDNNFFQLAEEDDGPTVAAMQELAKQHGVWLVAPFFEMEKNCVGRYYNSAVVLSPKGEKVGKYRKQHLPNISWTHEKFYFTPGNLGSPVFD
jgi:N-carbamoylputrescine amidase